MNYHKQQGLSLLEILITALILSLGLLGLAGLQVQSLSFNHSAYLRSQATMLAYEMADRVRANSTPAVPSTISNYNTPTVTNPGTVAGCLNTTGCSISDMARTDLSQWKTTLAANLPNGQGMVCFDATPSQGDLPAAHGCDGNANSPLVVKIWWTDDKGNATPQLFFMSFRP